MKSGINRERCGICGAFIKFAADNTVQLITCERCGCEWEIHGQQMTSERARV
jgi:hypothetical protein